jgi:putative endonuclease
MGRRQDARHLTPAHGASGASERKAGVGSVPWFILSRGNLSFVIPGRALRASPESITPALAMAFYVYLLASKKHGTLYLGVTRDIVRRGYEHRTKAVDGFTSRYGVDKLVWFEIYDDAISAITREKELKKWRRDWKIRLIEEQNPGWVDLYPGISS